MVACVSAFTVAVAITIATSFRPWVHAVHGDAIQHKRAALMREVLAARPDNTVGSVAARIAIAPRPVHNG